MLTRESCVSLVVTSRCLITFPLPYPAQNRQCFPVSICVTKLSGVGDDAVFLGMLRPMALSKRDVRAWIAPNGIILCSGPMFSALTGIPGQSLAKVYIVPYYCLPSDIPS